MSMLAALLLTTTLAVTAQAPPGPPVARALAPDAPVAGTPAHAAYERALAALEAGDRAGAAAHVEAALVSLPDSPALWRALARACAEDADARHLAVRRLAACLCDAKGRVALDPADKASIAANDRWPLALARARAEAIAELARFADRLPTRGAKALGSGLLARWAADLALEIGAEVPVALHGHAATFDAACANAAADWDLVFDALLAIAEARPPTAGSDAAEESAHQDARSLALERGMRAARALTGLAAQARMPDLEGPPPPALGALPARATAALERLRAEVRGRSEPWTIEALRALGEAERLAFTERHATWSNPGIARSPTGLYEIHTTCGFDTLLAAAETVEQHHHRLAGLFGSDPFGDRPGIVRIDPDHAGLESEGAPFWWAGGFQAGDVTTLRNAFGNAQGLGRGLTHELTHRFDGTLHPFQPAWLVEGHAVWTAKSYAAIADPSFVERYLDVGALQTPFVAGYGDVGKLETLLTGEIEDYRDNYSAGYALFVFLRTWRVDGKLCHAEALQRFRRNARAGRADPVGFFTAHFADGRDGRPDGLEAFAAAFREFLHQGYRRCWGENDAANAFFDTEYTTTLAHERPSGMFADEPTWSWARNRAEPWFGQQHAFDAGRLLLEVGDAKAAATALCIAASTDGWRRGLPPALARALDAARAPEAAWVARLAGRLRGAGSLAGDAEPAPMLARLPKVRALLAALHEAAGHDAEAGRALGAAVTGAQHDRLAVLVGQPPLGLPVPPGDGSTWPRRALPVALSTSGWTEDGLVGFEERRVAGLWFETENLDLHVGRARPRDATGTIDRTAHQRHAFVRTTRYEAPGRYVVRARIHFTTSHVSGALVFGWTRRDRNLRLHFDAGDFLYSIGRKDEDAKVEAVDLHLAGGFERDAAGALPGGRPRARFEFEHPTTFVDLELEVDGPTVTVRAMDRRMFAYTTPDALPIEGAIGFATAHGAVRVAVPTVQRLDRDERGSGAPAEGFAALLGRPLPGITAGADGAIVVVLPTDPDPAWTLQTGRRALEMLARPIRSPEQHPQPWLVMVPEGLPDAGLAELRATAEGIRPGAVRIVPQVPLGFAPDDLWVLFVDAFGIVRAAETPEGGFPNRVAAWSRTWRGPRELAGER